MGICGFSIPRSQLGPITTGSNCRLGKARSWVDGERKDPTIEASKDIQRNPRPIIPSN